MLSIGVIVLGVTDMHRAANFWSQALGYVLRDEEINDKWTVLVPVIGSGAPLVLQLSQSPVQERPRMHLDLFAGDAADQAAEVERLVSLGAQHVGWDTFPEDPDFVVLADPEGNRFCVIDTTHG
jgi:predicted enzyme related to lactoylglutathione lyase